MLVLTVRYLTEMGSSWSADQPLSKSLLPTYNEAALCAAASRLGWQPILLTRASCQANHKMATYATCFQPPQRIAYGVHRLETKTVLVQAREHVDAPCWVLPWTQQVQHGARSITNKEGSCNR